MAKIVVQHDTDPAIGMILEEVPPGTGRAQGTYGRCTECPQAIHRWDRDNAIRAAKQHVDGHTAQVAGIDPDSVVPGHVMRDAPVIQHETLELVGHNID